MKSVISCLLALSVLVSLLSGCGSKKSDVYIPTGDGLSVDETIAVPEQTEPETEQELILTYYPDRSMNPYLCTDFTNQALFSLLYQGLFVVDRDYNVEPMLYSRYTMSEDMKTYTFYIEKATFSNGVKLTAQDVLASLQAARESSIYSGRFLHTVDIRLSEDGGVTIQLDTSCENLPVLLDIPIVRQSQVEEDRPLGTGPYYLEETPIGATLRRRTNWWCSADMLVTAPAIALMEAESNTQIRDAFQFEDLSLVYADPGSDRYADYRCDFELWDCENGIFLYLACSDASPVFSNPNIQKALTYAIDRDTLVSNFYRGFARSATLPASPLFPYYNETLASKYTFDSVRFAKVVKEENLQDSTAVLLVNSDDSLRVRVARAVAKMLNECGLNVQTKELSGYAYRTALQDWNFDLLLGQTRLSANMDLSAFFSGYGALSYGGVSDVTAYTLCLQALENHGNYYTLYQTVMENGLLCPILFGSYAVYATRGVLTGLTPSRDNVFYYSLGKTMEQALIRPETIPEE